MLRYRDLKKDNHNTTTRVSIIITFISMLHGSSEGDQLTPNRKLNDRQQKELEKKYNYSQPQGTLKS